MNKEEFKFYLPADFEKASDSKGNEVMKVFGIASNSNRDSQGEYLDPSQMDLTEFKWINWNHLGSKDPGTLIGEPTKKEITKSNELFIEGILYPEVDQAKKTWTLMNALRKSPSGNRLSLSVEGKVVERGSTDPSNPLYNKILKSKITGVAICPTPINGGTWVDLLKKGYTSDEEEEYDDETKKAIVAEDSVTAKEDVEHDVKPTCSMKKSDVFERIYDLSPDITVEKAKSVYQLIEKISAMSTNKTEITEETISKAFEILNLASAQSIEKADTGKKDDKKDDDEDEDEKEMVTKAYEKAKLMKADGSEDEEIKKKLSKKGYNEKVVEKAMGAMGCPTAKVEKSEVASSILMAGVITPSISKADVETLLKSQSDSLGEKFQALGTILKAQSDENADLKKSVETLITENADLKAKTEAILKAPVGAKSIITKSYSSKFEKSADGTVSKKFNLNSKTDRDALKFHLHEISNLNKGENIDNGLVNIAQELELMKGLTPDSAKRLMNKGIELVAE